MATDEAAQLRARPRKRRRSIALLRVYRWLPHRLINATVGRAMTVERPRWLIRWIINAWIRRGAVDMSDFVEQEWKSVEAWFLRALKPGVRPLGDGVVSPADGVLVSAGEIARNTLLQVKGQPYSLSDLLGRSISLDGGYFVTVFLTPDGYHHVHAPVAGRVAEQWHLPGRFYPQNEDALRHIEAVYTRNVRVVLRLQCEAGDVWLVLVGASLIGGIHLTVGVGDCVEKGARIGWFSFGSTVVTLLPRELGRPAHPEPGSRIHMGQELIDL